MKLKTKYYINLDKLEKTVLLDLARGISQDRPTEEFISYVESLINGAADIIENNLTSITKQG